MMETVAKPSTRSSHVSGCLLGVVPTVLTEAMTQFVAIIDSSIPVDMFLHEAGKVVQERADCLEQIATALQSPPLGSHYPLPLITRRPKKYQTSENRYPTSDMTE